MTTFKFAIVTIFLFSCKLAFLDDKHDTKVGIIRRGILIRSVRLQSPGSLDAWRPSPPFAQAVLETLGIALPTGDVLQLGSPEPLQEGVWSLLLHLHPVEHP